VWDPAGNEGIAIVAFPVASSVPTPIEIESSEKVTKPVGSMEPPLETAAEITTGVSVGRGLWLAETVVVVGDCNIVIAIIWDLLVTSFESPL
jgi:hypothetical protein